MNSLSQEYLVAVFDFLFSGNGIMTSSPQVKQQAAFLFLSMYKQAKTIN
jgi:hypothetical protein